MRRLGGVVVLIASAGALLVGCDKTAPSTPNGVTATAVACSQVELRLAPSTDAGGSGLRGYNVYRDNGTLVKFAQATSATTMKTNVTALAASTAYGLKVEAVDYAGNKSAMSATVNVTTPACAGANQAPTVAAGSDRIVTSLDQLALTGANSSDSDGSIAEYEFNWGDDTPSTVTAAPTKSASHAWTRAGAYAVTITVRDDDGAVASDTLNVDVSNRAPVASFTAPATASADDTVTFDASASADPDGDIVSYQWNVGEASLSGKKVTYNYNYAQTYSVTLQVTDNLGRIGSVTKSITVTPGNVAPVANFTAATNTFSLLPVSYDGSASTDSDGAIVEYRWDFDGNGTADETTSTPTTSHTFSRSGAYLSTLTVVDDDGATHTRTASVNISNRRPRARLFVSSTIQAGTPVTFDGRMSSDADGDIVAYNFSIEGGPLFAPTANATMTHTFTTAGVYVVRLSVQDNTAGLAGLSNQMEWALEVINGPVPTADAGPDIPNAHVGVPVAFNGTATDPGGTAIDYAWNFDDGGNWLPGQSITHTFTAPGVYMVMLYAHRPGSAYIQYDYTAVTVT